MDHLGLSNVNVLNREAKSRMVTIDISFKMFKIMICNRENKNLHRIPYALDKYNNIWTLQYTCRTPSIYDNKIGKSMTLCDVECTSYVLNTATVKELIPTCMYFIPNLHQIHQQFHFHLNIHQQIQLH
jgi:hypothetical protein